MIFPCPFCNAPAEKDLMRGFINFQRQPGNAVAIYCTECEADMSLCYGDFPGDTPEHLLSILTQRWNKRDRLDDCLQQDRIKTNEINILVKENRRLVEACHLVLLFHSGSPWDFEKQQAWANGLTAILGNATSRDPKVVGANGDGTWDRACPTNEATTKNLCNAVRAALAVQ